MEAYSCRSGKSSQRKTGRGLQASNARARNDSLLISYNKRCSINLWELPGVTTRLLRVLIEESVAVSFRVGSEGSRSGPVSSANRAGQARVSVAVCRSLSLLRSAVPARFNTPWPTWRTLQTHAAQCSLRAAQPPRSHKQPFPRSFARVRARETLGVRGKQEEEGK